MRYPCDRELRALGEAAGTSILSQEKIDALVGQHVSGITATPTDG